jgi:hypothetical protein
VYLDIKGDLPEGKYHTIIPSIDDDPSVPFILWTPNGPYIQCTSNEDIIKIFALDVASKFPNMNVSGAPVFHQSEQAFCEHMLDILDRNNCKGFIHWIESTKQVTINRDSIALVMDGKKRFEDLGENHNFEPWLMKEGKTECTGWLIVPKDNPKIHTYNMTLGGLSLVVHKHYDNAQQHAQVIENTPVINSNESLQPALMRYPDQYNYMSFLMQILNKRKAHGIWIWNSRGEGFFMPKNKVFSQITNQWLTERIS